MKEPIRGISIKKGEWAVGSIIGPYHQQPIKQHVLENFTYPPPKKHQQDETKKYNEWKLNRADKTHMKVLCLCAGGAVRSVTLAFVLKYEYKIDAIAASLEKNSEDTLEMLYKWADRIIVVQVGMEDNIPVEHLEKTLCLDIGPDRWGASLHQELLNICGNLLEQAFAGKSTYKAP